MVKLEFIEQTHEHNNDFLLTHLRIINSHPDFNNILNGNASLTLADIKNEVNEVFSMGGRYFMLKLHDVCVGVGHLLPNNPHDGHPWLGLLVIDRPFARSGIGRTAARLIVEEFASKHTKPVRLFVQKNNPQAFLFWCHCGFEPIEVATDECGREAYILQSIA
ncbi:GNAT family N-acetyltransferase [Aeromonas jandaei]|uniref:GNAT family N-acetyltransferase n=1 Tax=Aeromonas jandaei TaxID=650 RepID=UPI0038D041BB